jgi:hypothetical protein
LRKIIAVTLLLSMLLGISTVVCAAGTTVYYQEYAEKLSGLGVFRGTGTGFELEREPTRLEGLIMLIRLLGKESEANLLANEESEFSDVPAWGRGYTNYAYKNGLAKGIGNGLFGANNKIDAKSFITFVLRALGYSDSGTAVDFTWNNAVDFAKSIGLLEEELYFKIVSNTFIRDYVAKISYNALLQPVKNSTMTLAEKLVAAGAITQAQADSLGLTGTGKAAGSGGGVLSSVEIGKLAKAVVRIEAVGYDGEKWSGSGFYTSKDGTVVTNYHVVEGARTLTFVESDGTIYNGSVRIIGYDADADIMVLDIDKTVEHYLKPGNSDNVVLGEKVYAIGYPLGLQVTVSDGIVSSLWPDGDIQITAAISHGNSGGVLLNEKGEAIGITYAIIEAGENLGFAIPINKYVKLGKNLSLTLADLNRITVLKPAYVTVRQISPDTVSIYWDPVSGTEYYCVYMAESIDGPYTRLTDSNGSWKLQWKKDSCITAGGLAPGKTYYFRVTAVSNAAESLPSDTVSVTLCEKSFEEYEKVIMEKYGVIRFGNKKAVFNDVSISDASDGRIYLWMYLDLATDHFAQFLSIMLDNRSDFENSLAEAASTLAGYYGRDVIAVVIYARADFLFYPDAFSVNAIYPDTIEYLEGTGTWAVWYPYVVLDYSRDSKTFMAVWAY